MSNISFDIDKMIKYYYIEWHYAEQDGNKEYAASCKNQYMKLVMEKLIKPYNYYNQKIKRFPMVNLN